MGAGESKDSGPNEELRPQLEHMVSEPRTLTQANRQPAANGSTKNPVAAGNNAPPPQPPRQNGGGGGGGGKPIWSGLCAAIKRGSLGDLEAEIAKLTPPDDCEDAKKQTLLKRKTRKLNELQRGFSPLHLACERGDTAMTRVLLDAGADVNLKNRFKHTALYIAVKRYNDECARICLEYGADIDGHCDWFNPLLVSCRRGNLRAVALLLEHGASTSCQTRCDDLDTPLHVATRCGFLSVVQILISHGADIDARNSDLDTPLIIAARIGNVEVLRELGNCGANLQVQNGERESAFQVACLLNHFSCVEYLLRAGADPIIMGPGGHLPLQSTAHGFLLYIREAYDSAVPLHDFVCSPVLSDVLFRVSRLGVDSPAAASCVPAHAIIVGSRCAVLRGLIQEASASYEAGQSEMLGSMLQVSLHLDCDPDGFQALLYYLYTDRLPWHAYLASAGIGLVQDLQRLAVQFDLPRLESICALYLGSKDTEVLPSTFHKDLNQMLTSDFGQEISDITIIPEGEVDTYPAHQVMLAAYSPLFEKTLTRSPPGTDHSFFTISSKYDAQLVPVLLATIYGQESENFITPNNYTDLVKFAHLYGSKSLLESCERYMRQRLSDETVLQFLRTVPSYPRLTHLRAYCLQYCAFRFLVLGSESPLAQRITPEVIRDMVQLIPSRWRSLIAHRAGQHDQLSESDEEIPGHQQRRRRGHRRIESPMTDCPVPSSPQVEKVAYRAFSNRLSVEFLAEGPHIERIRTRLKRGSHR